MAGGRRAGGKPSGKLLEEFAKHKRNKGTCWLCVGSIEQIKKNFGYLAVIKRDVRDGIFALVQQRA